MTNEKRTTWILFGQAGQNVAQGDPKFGRTLTKAFGAFYGTRSEASDRLMGFCEAESDNYLFSDDGTAVQMWLGDHEDGTATYEKIMEAGDLRYDHDSRTWWYEALDEMSEDRARLALQSGILSEGEENDIYTLHPDLKPETNEDED